MSRRSNCNFETKEAFSQTKWAFSELNLRLWIFYCFPRDTPGLWLPFKGYITFVVGLRNSITPIVQLRLPALFPLQHGRYEPFEIISRVASIFNIFCRGWEGSRTHPEHTDWEHPGVKQWGSGSYIDFHFRVCSLQVNALLVHNYIFRHTQKLLSVLVCIKYTQLLKISV